MNFVEIIGAFFLKSGELNAIIRILYFLGKTS